MFCPNCGTSNEDTAPRCKQCGFELQQAKPAAPKFKGTMLLGQSPFAGQPAGDGAKAGAEAAPGPAAGGQAAPRPAATGASRAALKGTMVGVAPPGVGSPTPPGQAGGAGEQRPAQPKPTMKGTMIGLAPPAVGGPAVGGAGATGLGAPAPAGPQAEQGAAGASAAGARQIPSKLKGTMIGVAPPSLGGQGAEGTAPTMVMPSQAPAMPGSPNPGLHGTAGPAPAAGTAGAAPAPGLARTEAIPAMGGSVNPLGGTVLGGPAPDFGAPTAQIPSAELPNAQNAGTQNAATQGSGTQGSGTQSAGTQAFAQTALSQAAPMPVSPAANPGAQQSSGDAPLAGGTLVVPAPPIAAALGGGPPPAGAIPASPGAITPAPGAPSAGGLASSGGRGPLGKVRNPVATLLLGMMCFVYALVAYIQMLGELKSFRQKNDLSLLLFFIPIINIIEVLKLPEKVADAQRMVGVQNPQVAHPVLYLFFGLYFFPADLNEVWEAARRNQG